MNQLICSSLSQTRYYWYEVGMFKASALYPGLTRCRLKEWVNIVVAESSRKLEPVKSTDDVERAWRVSWLAQDITIAQLYREAAFCYFNERGKILSSHCSADTNQVWLPTELIRDLIKLDAMIINKKNNLSVEHYLLAC